jgi:prepilin-type N-terminal cleavage/methylation domain-containing protein
MESEEGRMFTRTPIAAPRKRHHDAGFSVTELLVAVHILGIVAALAVNAYSNVIERARLARCLDELRGIQAAVWSASDNGGDFPNPAAFWKNHFKGAKPGPYVLLIDGNPATGGVDLDGDSMEGPDETGGGTGRRSVEFVVVYPERFGDLAEYVYIEDHGPPTIVSGPEDDPGYRRFAVWERDRGSDTGGGSDSGFGSGSGSGGGGSAGSSAESMVGWSGSESSKTESAQRGWIDPQSHVHWPKDPGDSKGGSSSGRGSGSKSSTISD